MQGLTCRLSRQSHKEGFTLIVPTATALLTLASSRFAEGFRQGTRMYTAATLATRAAPAKQMVLLSDEARDSILVELCTSCTLNGMLHAEKANRAC